MTPVLPPETPLRSRTDCAKIPGWRSSSFFSNPDRTLTVHADACIQPPAAATSTIGLASDRALASNSPGSVGPISLLSALRGKKWSVLGWHETIDTQIISGKTIGIRYASQKKD